MNACIKEKMISAVPNTRKYACKLKQTLSIGGESDRTGHGVAGAKRLEIMPTKIVTDTNVALNDACCALLLSRIARLARQRCPTITILRMITNEQSLTEVTL